MEMDKISATDWRQESENQREYRETLMRSSMMAEEESRLKSMVGLRDVRLRHTGLVQGNDSLGRVSLQTMDDAMKNFKNGNVSEPIDLSDF